MVRFFLVENSKSFRLGLFARASSFKLPDFQPVGSKLLLPLGGEGWDEGASKNMCNEMPYKPSTRPSTLKGRGRYF